MTGSFENKIVSNSEADPKLNFVRNLKGHYCCYIAVILFSLDKTFCNLR